MKPGDRVVCIKTYIDDGFTGCVKGHEYVIIGIDVCKCGDVSLDVGIISPPNILSWTCDKCGDVIQDDGIWWQDPDHFRKLEYTSAHDELLSKIVEEKPDIILEPEKEKS